MVPLLEVFLGNLCSRPDYVLARKSLFAVYVCCQADRDAIFLENERVREYQHE